MPIVYGGLPERNIIIMEDLSDQSYREELEEASREGSNENKRKDLLYVGVKNVAKFVGQCSAKKEDFFASHPGYEQEAEMLREVSRKLFKGYLERVVHTTHRSKLGGAYNPEVIDTWIRGKNIPLDERLAEIWEFSAALGTEAIKKKLIHGDFNPAHLKKHSGNYKVLDLEKFGPGEEAEDISSFLIIPAVNNYALIETQEAGHLLNRYLCYEYAYERQDKGIVGRLDKYKNGAFGDFIVDNMKMSQESYANFVLNFYAHAIRKNIQLASLFGKIGSRVAEQGSSYIEELFREVVMLDTLTNSSTDPVGVRNYFYALGSLINELEIARVPTNLLDTIRQGTAAAAINRAIPEFKR